MAENSGRGRAVRLIAGLAMVAGLGLTTLAPNTVLAAPSCSEAKVADAAGLAFLNAAKSASPAAFASALRSYTNMNQITNFALGKYRSQVDPDRQSELVNLTSSYVATTLADFALKFRAADIKAIECGGGMVVSRMEFLGGKPAKRVQWRISGGKVNDVNIQNVWLAQLLRDNFAGVISRGGGRIDALYAHLGAGKGSTADVGSK